MLTLIKNIKELVQVESGRQKLRAMGSEMAQVETVKDAYLLVEDGKNTKRNWQAGYVTYLNGMKG